MASGLYLAGKSALLGGDIDLINDAVGAVLIDTSVYTPSLDTDTSLADIPEAAIFAEILITGKNIDTVEITGSYYSVFRADDALFPAVPTSTSTVNAIVLFKDADTFSASTLILINDSAPEFPITPDGTDITVVWDAGNDGVFRF